jgi:hypothetical protein
MDRISDVNELAKRIVYYVLGILEVLLLFRFLFKLLGANPNSAFISFVYTLSNVFLAPFNGIFRPFVTEGIETRAVFEPATIIAMLVYAVLAYGIVRFLELRKSS